VKVSVFGSGYVGLVQAATLAEVGNEIVCVDIDAKRVATLGAGSVPMYEPDLEPMVRRNLKDGRLRFTTVAREGVAHGAIIFIAVGTPARADGGADLGAVHAVARSIGQYMDGPRTVVVKSTVPVGTADAIGEAIRAALAERRAKHALDIASNPEFLKEGAAVADCMKPDRIIIGTSSAEAERQLRRLYAPFNRNHETIMVMDTRSAELTKYAANAMLATKISFMNEMANFAELLGADIEKVRRGIGADPRIGYHFIYPGIGYGGSCFPKDVDALMHMADEKGFEPFVLSAVHARNESQKLTLVQKMERHFGGELRGRTFALWGLSFKPNTDDMRDAPSRAILEALWLRGASVRAYDPAAMEEARRIYGMRNDLTLGATKEDALAGADALIIATEWKAFQSVELETIRKALKQPVVFDGRNIYDPALAAEAGLTYYGIGRGG
jgi:UDPglucose 6-dehydrogenase